MTRSSLAVVGALAILVLPGTAAAQADVFQAQGSGTILDAYWTTFSESSVPEPGVVHTNTHVWAVDGVSQENGERSLVRDLYVDELTFMFDELGRIVPLAAVNGFVSGAAVTFAVDRQLRSGYVEAMVDFVGCVPVPDPITPRFSGRDLLLLCGSDSISWSEGTAPVRVSWSGHGDLIDGSDRLLGVSPCFTGREAFWYSEREASSFGSFAGRELGPSWYATISEGRGISLFVEHLPHAPRPLCPPPSS